MFYENDKNIENKFKSIFNNESPGSIFYNKGKQEANKKQRVIENFEIATDICLESINMNENSKEPRRYGTYGFTRGRDIYIANGVRNKEEVLAHELVHLFQNLNGDVDNELRVNGESFNLNQALERQADLVARELIVPTEDLNIEKIRKLLGIGKGGMNVPRFVNNDGPIQCWGVGGIGALIMSLLKGRSLGVSEGEHEAIIRTSVEAVNKAKSGSYSEKDIEGLKRGCNFNDNYSQNHISFLFKYCLGNDEYLNETQEGSLVMLHCMGPEGEVFENKAKINEWFNFCLNAYYDEPMEQGSKHFQEITLLEYVKLNQKNAMLLEMFLPIMLKKEAIEDLKFSLMVGDDNYYDAHDGRDRTEILTVSILELLKRANFNVNDSRLSKYAKMTVGEFFCPGDNIQSLDKRFVSMIAAGSLLHLVHDSMANAHAQRAYDPRVAEDKRDGTDFRNYDKVIERVSPIINIQDSIRQVNHNYGDYFCLSKSWLPDTQGRIDNTNGARQAQLVTKSILYMLSEGVGRRNVLDFLNTIMKLDKNVKIIDKIKRIKDGKLGLDKKIACINELKAGTELEDLDFLNKEISLTAGGRGYDDYEIGCDEPQGSVASRTGQIYMKNVRDNEVRNDIKGLELRLNLYKEQLDMLEIIAKQSINKKTKDVVRKHIVEILVNVLNIVRISGNERAKVIKDRCINIINKFT